MHFIFNKKIRVHSLCCKLCWWPANVNSLYGWNIRTAVVIIYSSPKEDGKLFM